MSPSADATITATRPTPSPDVPVVKARIESIDVLRGFALLGILLVNVQSFAMIEAAYANPTAYGDLSGPNFVVWLTTHVLADQKMMTIFSMLFGAGIVLMAESRARSGRSPAAAHYRRMGGLLLFGLAHAYVLWAGDILVTYALCGLVAYLFRRVRPGFLVPIGLALLVVPSAIFLFAGWSVRFWPPETLAEIRAEMQPGPEAVAAELAAFRGGWLAQSAYRLPAALYFQTFIFAIWAAWRALGLMLIGMAFCKWGVFSAARSRRFYASLLALGLFVGLPIVAYGVIRGAATGWGSPEAFFLDSQFNYWASLLVSLGWVGGVMLLCQAGPRAAFATAPLAAVGRLALSNYLLQTLLCTTIFYGHGLGLFGHVQRSGQFAIVVAIWTLQLVLSPIYLRHFRMGPAEWLWRCLTDLKAPRLRA